MRPMRFPGDSLRCLRDFPGDAKHDVGYQPDKVQRGQQPDDLKPMPAIGKGVEEIRIWDDSGTYRVVYTPRALLTRSMYCMPSRRKLRPHRNATLTLRRLDTVN